MPIPLPDLTASRLQLSDDSRNSNCDEMILIPCDWNAPEGECVMTRVAVLWTRVSYKIWYFGSIFYWISWVFLFVVIIEACIAMFRPSLRKLDTSSTDENVE